MVLTYSIPTSSANDKLSLWVEGSCGAMHGEQRRIAVTYSTAKAYVCIMYLVFSLSSTSKALSLLLQFDYNIDYLATTC